MVGSGSEERTRDSVVADHSTAAFTGLADLASMRVGGRALDTNDEFFAPLANLIKPEPPVFIPGKFTARGKWMDGWESRRRRVPGHDWGVIALGMRGVIHGINVDTHYFTGNFPSHCSLDALDSSRPPGDDECAAEGEPWTNVLAKSALRGDSNNFFTIDDRRPWTHVRLNIYPDGGVARLRVHGEVAVDWQKASRSRTPIDLASIKNGGLVLAASDMHFGAKDNMIMPGRAANMGDGWETRRRRGPGYDWAIVRLGTTGVISKVEIDTNHFKGNYPDSASLEGCLAPGATVAGLSSVEWVEIVPQIKLRAHHRHFFTKDLGAAGLISHVRLNIFPDGGVSRLRVYGNVAGA
jgi:allantoicase